MVRVPAFQAGYAGSIPVAGSIATHAAIVQGPVRLLPGQ